MKRTYSQRILPTLRLSWRMLCRQRDLGDIQQEFAIWNRAHVLARNRRCTVEGSLCDAGVGFSAIAQPKKAVGQLFRIVGAATKTVLGWLPR